MFASKISSYAVVQWASQRYDAAKKGHAWFGACAERAEKLSAPVVAALPKLPGALTVDSAAATTVTRVEGMVASAQKQVTAAQNTIVRVADAALTTAGQFAAKHPVVAWPVRAPLRMGDAVVGAVLPVQSEAGQAIKRVPADAVPHSLVEALAKHVDLAHTLRTRLAGKTLRQLMREAAHGSVDSAVRLASLGVDMLPADVQAAVRDSEGRKKNGLIMYALHVTAATAKFCAITLPMRVLNALRSQSRRATAAVTERAVTNMQELGTRGIQVADKARDAIRRRVTAATSFGRTGNEPSDAKKATNGSDVTAASETAAVDETDREHSD